MRADWLFRNGTIYAAPGKTVEALAIRGSRVIAAGPEAEVLHTACHGTRVVDLAGRAVVPGLVDCHLHLLAYGLSQRQVRLAGSKSLAEAVELIRQRAENTPHGEWVVAQGFLEDRWPERRLPTRCDLDKAAPAHPAAAFRADMHLCVANSLALGRAGIAGGVQDPVGGQIDRDEAGEPTGVLRENAVDLLTRVMPGPSMEEMRSALAGAVRDAARSGITEVHSDDLRTAGSFAAAWRVWNEIAGPEGFPLRAYLLISEECYEECLRSGLKPGSGNGWVRVGPVKLFADGSLGSHTAALRAPYADQPDSRGILVHSPEELFALVERYHRDGQQIACHCIGDGAIELFLDALAAADQKYHRPDPRHRVIHAQVCPPDLQRRMAELRVIADIQPKFIHSDGHFYEARLGRERSRWFNPWRSMREQGIPCCSGSDCPVEPFHMPWQLHAAVARRGLDGEPPEGWNPGERLSFAEALALHTTGAAYAAFAETFRGRLEPGMAADLVVLNRDPGQMMPEELKELAVHLTMVGGQVAYEA